MKAKALFALLALAAAPIVVSATPAVAAPPAIRILSVSSDNVKSGATVRVRFRATNNDRRAQRAFVAVSGGLRCTAGCEATADLGPGRSATFNATVVAPQVGDNQQSGLNLAVSVRIGLQTGFDHKMILVSGAGFEPDGPTTAVRQVSGRVRDGDGTAVRGASVTVRDSAGHTYKATSDSDGTFTIRSSDSRPLAIGRITVSAAKEGYRTARVTVRGAAGRAVTARLTLATVAAPSSAPPSVAAEPLVADASVAPEESAAAAPPPLTLRTAAEEGDGLMIFMILGGLLVVAGLGMLIVMLTRRRKTATPDMSAPTMVLRAVPPSR